MRVALIVLAGSVLVVAFALAGFSSSERGDDSGSTLESRPPGVTRFVDVASEVGLDFRQGAFRWGPSPDVVAMMGGGVCWLDFDNDGWLDLYAVNSFAEREVARWRKAGGLPESALYRNVEGTFVDVSEASGANLAVRGNGCVAADLDLDGDTDLYVTTSRANALLWNNG